MSDTKKNAKRYSTQKKVSSSSTPPRKMSPPTRSTRSTRPTRSPISAKKGPSATQRSFDDERRRRKNHRNQVILGTAAGAAVGAAAGATAMHFVNKHLVNNTRVRPMHVTRATYVLRA